MQSLQVQAEVATTGRIIGAVTVAAAEDFADAAKQSQAVAAVLQAAKERPEVETLVFHCAKSQQRGPNSALVFQRASCSTCAMLLCMRLHSIGGTHLVQQAGSVLSLQAVPIRSCSSARTRRLSHVARISYPAAPDNAWK